MACRGAVSLHMAIEPKDRVAACSCEHAASSLARGKAAVSNAAPGNTWWAERLHGQHGVGVVGVLTGD